MKRKLAIICSVMIFAGLSIFLFQATVGKKGAADATATRSIFSTKQEKFISEKDMQQMVEKTTTPIATATPTTAKLKNDQELDRKLKEVIASGPLQGASVGVSVRDAKDGTLIYSHHGDTNFQPASNMKLLTGAAALETLGGDYTFETEILTDGKIDGNVLEGNLYIKGKGDPTLLKENLDTFAKQLHEKGIRKVTGHLIGDDTWYDDERYSQDLNWSDEFNYTGAAVSALTMSPNDDYDTGSIIVTVKANEKVGQAPHIEIQPKNDYVKVVNHAKTVRKGELNQVTIEREHGTNNLIIDGAIPSGSSKEVWRAVWEPTDFTLYMLQASLTEHGIKISSEVKRKKTPKDATVLVTHESMPLEKILIPFMKLSNNGHAEMLVKEMGRFAKGEGSWDKGLEVMADQLKGLGMDKGRFLLRDGSGMSHKDIVQPNELTALLYNVQSKVWFPAYEASQPVAGEHERLVGGTLSYRLTDDLTKGKVKAKTGSLTGVNTLSGYMTTKNGKNLIFSIMINNYIDGHITDYIDTIVKILAE